MLKKAAIVAGALVLGAHAAASTYPLEAYTGHVLHERRAADSTLNSRWKRNARIEADAIIPVRIGLKQSNLDAGAEQLMDISHPHSPNYGKHLTSEEVHNLFAPSDIAVSEVRDWLVGSGIDSRIIAHSDNKGWLAVDIPAEKAESLFRTELHEYEHIRTGDLRIGCDSYHIPGHLREHIDFVTPGVKFSHSLKKHDLKKRSSSSSTFWKSGRNHRPMMGPMPHRPWHPPPEAMHLPPELQGCGVNITPPCLRALYGIPVAHINDSVNSLGLYEQGDYYAQADLNSFFAALEPRVPQGTGPILKGVDGGYAPVAVNDTALDTGESDIDLDITISLIYPQSVTLYQVDDLYYAPREIALDNTWNTFLDALDGSYCKYPAYGITGDSPKYDPVYPDTNATNATEAYKGQRQCGVYKPTRVISSSYGESEGDFPKAYVERQCNEFMKLSLQGHTILFSSSDYGVGNFANDPDPNGCMSGFGQNSTIYNPDYPVGCPWVTAVGATQLYANQTIHTPESAMAVDLWSPGRPEAYHYFSSAGGFSNKFPAPAYQASALSTYFTSHDPGHPYYYANENLTNIGINGGIYNRAGRGYPDVSANGAYMLAWVNGELEHWFGTSLASPIWASVVTLINQERTAVGKGPVGFINPVLYSHPEVLNDIMNGSNPNCGSSGFSAVEGWDPVTGLGTPNYPRLAELFLGLP